MTSRKEGGLTLDQLIAMLAPVVGVEKSHEVVASAVASLGTYDADAVVNRLQAAPGVIGIAVRRIVRMSVPASLAQAAGDETPTGVRRRELAAVLASGGPDAAPTIATQTVVDLFAPSLGDKLAADLVQGAKRQLGIGGDRLGLQEALRVLDALAAEEGLAGITARFAKARVILLFRPAPDAVSRKP